MRYFNEPEYSFTNKQGRTVPIKLKLDIPDQAIASEIQVPQGFELDEVASRNSIYGEAAEDQAYKIFFANVTQIVEAGYDLSKIRRLRIPV